MCFVQRRPSTSLQSLRWMIAMSDVVLCLSFGGAVLDSRFHNRSRQVVVSRIMPASMVFDSDAGCFHVVCPHARVSLVLFVVLYDARRIVT
jgi:hypothetical protein